MNTSSLFRVRRPAGFTVIEVLVSTTVLAILLALVSEIVGNVQQTWRRTNAKIYQFREARRAFETIKKNLAQATLNPYMRYVYKNPKNVMSPYDGNVTSNTAMKEYPPAGWTRFSDLQFISVPSSYLLQGIGAVSGAIASQTHCVFFQLPLGQSLTQNASDQASYMSLVYGAAVASAVQANPPVATAMNGRGYFILYGSDIAYAPSFLKNRVNYKLRYRLMEFAPPTEFNDIYNLANAYDPLQATGTATPPQPSSNVASEPTSKWITEVAAGSTTPNYLAWSHAIADNVVALVVSPQTPVASSSSTLPTSIAPNYYYNSSEYQITSNASNLANEPSYAFNLPPQVQITMIVIDEATGASLATLPVAQTTPPITWQVGWFNLATSYATDLAAVESTLIGLKANYRIFTAVVPIRNSRWNGYQAAGT